MPLVLSCPADVSQLQFVPYSSSFTRTGGTGPFIYTIIAGALPTGLTLAASTGLVSGTPSVVNTFNFTGKVTDSLLATDTHACSIQVLTNGTNYPLRRARRFPLPYAQNLRMFLTRLQIFLQVGMADDPPIYIRLSKNGGFTWGDYQTLTAGTVGQYKKRVFLNVNSSARNWVAELVVDFPSQWYLVDAFADIEQGLN